MFKPSRLLFAFGCIGFVSVADAQVAFTSFAPGDTFLSGGYISGHNLSTTNWRQTFRFQSALTGQLDYLRFAVSHRGGDTNFVVRLRSDNAGEPGTPIVRFDLTDSTTDPGHVLFVDAGPGAPVLNAGQSYWFEFFTDSTTAYHRFHRTTTSLTLPWRGSNNTDDVWDFSGTVSAPAFEVSVVPEPATLVALSVGALALASRRRRK
jgi:hypothetical protein